MTLKEIPMKYIKFITFSILIFALSSCAFTKDRSATKEFNSINNKITASNNRIKDIEKNLNKSQIELERLNNKNKDFIKNQNSVTEKLIAIKNRVDTNEPSLEKYAQLTMEYTGGFLVIASLLIIVCSVIYYTNLRGLKREADEDLNKIKVLATEAEKLLTSQKKVYCNFENEAKRIFEDANVPPHFISDEAPFSFKNEKKITNDQKERLKYLEVQLLVYKSLPFEKGEDISKLFIRIGHYYHRFEKDFEKAIIFYEYAIQVYPDNYNAYNDLGRSLQKLKRYEAALRKYEKSLEINDNYWPPYYNIGWIYDEWEDYFNAIGEYKKAEELAPNEDAIPYNIACSYSKFKDQKSSYKYLERAVSLNLENKQFALDDPDLKLLRNDKEYGPKVKELCK